MCAIEDICSFSKSIATEGSEIHDLTNKKTHETNDVIQILSTVTAYAQKVLLWREYKL